MVIVKNIVNIVSGILDVHGKRLSSLQSSSSLLLSISSVNVIVKTIVVVSSNSRNW